MKKVSLFKSSEFKPTARFHGRGRGGMRYGRREGGSYKFNGGEGVENE